MMISFSRWLVSRVVPGFTREATAQERARIGMLEGWVSIGVNVLLFALKIALGLFTGSVSLIADAVHSLSDSLTSLMVIVGFRMSTRPPDQKHPFGHGRMESIATVVIAVLLGVMAVEMVIASVNRLLHPRPFQAEIWVIVVLAGTMVLKYLLSRFSGNLAAMIDSDALRADEWHHKSDVLSTLLVLIAFFGARWNLVWLDGVMGVGVAAIIAWAAVAIMRGASGPLLGMPAPEEMYREIYRIARSAPEVHGVHDILVHRYGSTNIISLHIEVPGTETPMRLHEISEEIEEQLALRFPGHAIVHVDPINSDHENYEVVRRIVEEVLAEAWNVVSYHDLRLLGGGGGRLRVVFDVILEAGAGESGTAELQQKIEQLLRDRFPRVRVIMNVEPPYFRNVSNSQPDENETSG